MSNKKPPKPGIRRSRSAISRDGRELPTGGRSLALNVKSAKGRKSSSTRWLKRQLNDPYVLEAKKRGYRSRSAFKLIELDDKYQFLRKGARVIDLGAAPGGWCQVAAERTGSLRPESYRGQVVGIDLKEIDAIAGTKLLQGDFLDDNVLIELMDLIGQPVDVVLSDMASPATGHTATDHLRIMGLLEAAVDFAVTALAPGGTFVGKVLRGGTENELLVLLKRNFKIVRHAKPPASRQDSAESYVVAKGFYK